jgi:nucleoside phosphorylase
MKLGVIAALQTELDPTLRALAPALRKVGHLRCHEAPGLVITAGGIGARHAAAAALLMADTFKPDALVSVGFCGALTAGLDTGDLLIGGTTAHPASAELLQLARSVAPHAKSGDVLTVPKVVVQAEQKQALARETGAVAVDMEADAVALAAKARGLGFLSVKAVIDTPAEPLASTYAGCWTVARDLLIRPGTITQMIYDSKRVKIAAERLKEFFVALARLTA